jgi:hypothetical protein
MPKFRHFTLILGALFSLSACNSNLRVFTGNNGGNNGGRNGGSLAVFEPTSGITADRSTNGQGRAMFRNADGSSLLVGDFTTYGDIFSRRGIVSLLANGNVDTSARLNLKIDSNIYTINSSTAAQAPDKSLYVAYGLLNSPSRIVKFTSTRNLDDSYVAPTNAGDIRKLIVQSDGRLLYLSVSSAGVYTLNRLLANGALDTSFPAMTVLCPANVTCPLTVNMKDEIFAHTANGVVHLSPDGVPVPNFASPMVTGTLYGLYWKADKLYLYGRLTSVNNVTRNGLARVDAITGALDDIFTGAGPKLGTDPGRISAMSISGSKIGLGGAFDTFDGHVTSNVAVFSTQGNVDKTFSSSVVYTASQTNFTVLNDLQFDEKGNIFITGNWSKLNNQPGIIAQLSPTGALDPNYGALKSEPGFDFGVVTATKHLANGKTLVAGTLGVYSGQAIPSTLTLGAGLIRLNADGSLDSTFVSNFPSSRGRTRILEAPNGDIYVVGPDGLPAHILANGTMDSNFNPTINVAPITNFMYAIMDIQPATNLLVAVVPDGANTYKLARYTNTGALDANFGFTLSGTPRGVSFQKDGTFVIQTDVGLSRYLANASLDTNFSGANQSNLQLTPDPLNVKRWYGFGTRIQRYDDKGLDATFTTPEFTYDGNLFGKATVLADGRVVVIGSPRSPILFGQIRFEGIAIVNLNGTVSSYSVPADFGDALDMNSYIVEGKVHVIAGGDIRALAGPARGVTNLNVSEFPKLSWK